MIRLFFVGDGERDGVSLPPLVKTILNTDAISADFSPWPRLHRGGKGYERKLAFACRQAEDSESSGVVAVIDGDGHGRERMKALRAGRDQIRLARPPMPTALGCAEPHGEVWLLDDPVAVREGLRASDADVPNIRKLPSTPKYAIHALRTEHAPDRSIQDVLADIAGRVQLARSQHAAETGLKAFAQELQDEIAVLVSS